MEDFTTYTEVDLTGYLSQTALVSTYTNMPNDQALAYLYKDYTAGFFTGNFRHNFDFKSTNNGNNAEVIVWSVGNGLGTWFANLLANQQQVDISAYCPAGGSYQLSVEELDGSGSNYGTSSSTTYIANTTYYCQVYRDTTIGSFGTLFLSIYSNSARTILLENISLALHSNLSYRYIFAPQSYRVGGGNGTQVSGTVSNLDFSAAPVVISPFPSHFKV